MNKFLLEILNDLRHGEFKRTMGNAVYLNQLGMDILSKKDLSGEEVETLGLLVRICNILYNDTDIEILPIEDGVYDILLEKYKKYDKDFQVGAEVIRFASSNNDVFAPAPIDPIEFFDKDKIDNSMYSRDILSIDPRITRNDVFLQDPISFDYGNITKRKHDTSHNHPELVGTLDKCKFVLTKDAVERGVDLDFNVKILERDFFADHIKAGIIDPNSRYTMVLELKYDGISVEADVTNIVESARSRGDTGIGLASDLTPILEGYAFPKAPPSIKQVGVKFEAIMTNQDLYSYNAAKGKNYKNCRSAIVGLFSSNDGWMYRDYITLIPLQLDFESLGLEGYDRFMEIEIMNSLYSTKGQPLRYAIIEGNYIQLLYQIKVFQEEMEYFRGILPFMYDGIVVSYLDDGIRKALGRKNFVNKYSMAVKFNPLKKQTIFRDYQYTVGQDGSITPMIYYDPVEFYGTIHPKSTGHSYSRFMELGLKYGDIIDVEYVNDVMPYVNKPINEHNKNNPNPIAEFVTECPVCGSTLTISESGKSVKCNNMDCSGRKLSRMVNMMDKLNLSDFAESAITTIGKYHLKDIIDLDVQTLRSTGLGEVDTNNFIDRMNHLKTDPIYDYQIFGALGFTGVAVKTWKSIFAVISLSTFIFETYITDMAPEGLRNALVSIKGIGPATADTIINELGYFKDDIAYISNMRNILSSTGTISSKSIRFTGFRNKELSERLISMGYDADDNGSVTKSTDILLVPHEGFNQGSKMKKTGPNTLIVPVEDFINDMDKYLK